MNPCRGDKFINLHYIRIQFTNVRQAGKLTQHHAAPITETSERSFHGGTARKRNEPPATLVTEQVLLALDDAPFSFETGMMGVQFTVTAGVRATLLFSEKEKRCGEEFWRASAFG